MTAKLYSLSLSHPARASRLMLELKGIDHEVVDLLPGMHPVQLRAARFRHGTVPALKVDGKRIQGSVPISRFLERLRPQPPLFPAEPAPRRAVEEAEAWGERELQPIPRQIFRWGTVAPASCAGGSPSCPGSPRRTSRPRSTRPSRAASRA